MPARPGGTTIGTWYVAAPPSVPAAPASVPTVASCASVMSMMSSSAGAGVDAAMATAAATIRKRKNEPAPRAPLRMLDSPIRKLLFFRTRATRSLKVARHARPVFSWGALCVVPTGLLEQIRKTDGGSAVRAESPVDQQRERASRSTQMPGTFRDFRQR
jgi:hypothetical protein